MGRLIDADKLKNIFLKSRSKVFDYRIVIQEIAYAPTVEAIPKADYELLSASITMMKADYNARLKADMVAMLTEIQLEIEEHKMTSGVTNQGTWNECIACCSRIVQRKINALKGEQE